ncbi:MAG: hypothetical protein RIT28_3495 [Pseudomonadota bacterium]|jgi:hypothetical protein
MSLVALLIGASALLRPALAGEADDCLRNKMLEGYAQGWSVRTSTSASLKEGESRVYSVTLYKGAEYQIFACADAQAVDVRLVLHDADGQVLLNEDAVDRQPVLTYTAPATATYYVAVHAADTVSDEAKAAIGMAVTWRQSP